MSFIEFRVTAFDLEGGWGGGGDLGAGEGGKEKTVKWRWMKVASTRCLGAGVYVKVS